VMIRLGRVKGNLMVDVNASNNKLRDRAIRLVSTLRSCSLEEARLLLEKQAWSVRACL
jgi:N-acetylmuramic acid 6-phosphate etherase